MSKLFYGSIDVTTLLDNLKSKHSAFTKSQNGKIYASVNVWLNSEKDKYGNIMAIQINPSQENKAVEKKVYIGNLKESEGAKPISDNDVDAVNQDFDAPMKPSKTGSDIDPEPVGDLPF